MAPPLLLVVDDAPEIGFIVRRLGRDAGYDTTACGDVPAAWEYLQRTTDPGLGTPHARRPDLILLDLNLPGTPGLELCRRLRATPMLADLTVALFAHWDRAGDVAAGLAAGADAVISKDLLTQPATWADRLREILSGAPGHRVEVVLSCPGTASPDTLPQGVLDALNQAVRHPLARQAGPQVLEVLARRSVQVVRWWESAAGTRRPPPDLSVLPQPPAPGPDDWVLPTGHGLNPVPVARLGGPEAMVVFAVALADQLETVLGTAAAAPVWAALAAAVPDLAEPLARL
jgi:CheY-like chemotaxis protein